MEYNFSVNQEIFRSEMCSYLLVNLEITIKLRQCAQFVVTKKNIFIHKI